MRTRALLLILLFIGPLHSAVPPPRSCDTKLDEKPNADPLQKARATLVAAFERAAYPERCQDGRTPQHLLDHAETLLKNAAPPAQLALAIALLATPLTPTLQGAAKAIPTNESERRDVFDRGSYLIDRYLDQILHLQISTTEVDLARRQSAEIRRTLHSKSTAPAWSLAEPNTLGWSSHYICLLHVLDYLQPKNSEIWVDIGSGYGRLGLVMGLLHPKVEFHGYELVPERVKAAQRAAQKLNLSKTHFIEANVAKSEVALVPADYYFLYDSLNVADFTAFLGKLKMLKEKDLERRAFKLVVSYGSGRLYRQAQENEMLREVAQLASPYPGSGSSHIFEFRVSSP